MKRILTALLLLALVLGTAATALAADKFAFEQTNVTVFEGETLQIPLIRDGAFAEGGEITYASADTRVASVSADGTITGIRKGEVYITCTLKMPGGATKRSTATVRVARKVTSVALNTKRLNVYQPDDPALIGLMETEALYPVLVIPMGKQIELSAAAAPEDATNRKVLFETSDTDIAVIRDTTVLRGTKAGECDLKVYSKQNPEVTDMYHLVVVQPITKLTVVSPAKSVNVGSALQLDVDYQPDNATMKRVTWSVENANIASVDENGLVTALKRGTAVVKATAADGSGRSASISLNVQQGPESIRLKNTSEVINVGTTKYMSVTVLPENTNNKNLIWSSTDTSVATVTKNGTVKGVAVGSCQVICTCEADESVYAAIDIEVQQPVTKVAFTESKTTVDVNSSVYVTWTVQPATATNPGVTLKSNNEKIAVVDQTGRVTGIKKGTCKIIATSVDGTNRSGSITVQVTQPVEGVYFRQDIYHLPYRDYMSLHAYTEPKDADNQAMSWATESTYIATASPSHSRNNAVTLYGQHLGSTLIYVTTDDGGFTASAIVNVDHFYDPVQVTDIYLNNNAIKLRLLNQTAMTLTKVYFTMEVYDTAGQPLACNSKDGSHVFTGYYIDPLEPGDYTVHGRFHFDDFAQPAQPIGGLIMHITGFKSNDAYTLDGSPKEYSLNISTDKQVEARFPNNFKPAPVQPDADDDVG